MFQAQGGDVGHRRGLIMLLKQKPKAGLADAGAFADLGDGQIAFFEMGVDVGDGSLESWDIAKTP